MFPDRKKQSEPSLNKYLLLSLLILAVAFLVGAVVNIILSLCCGSVDSADRMVGMLEGIIGAIATGLVLLQLRSAEKTEAHQNDIEEASFLWQCNQCFLQDKSLLAVEHLLEHQAYYAENVEEIVTEENRQDFVNYLVYLESLAPLIANGVLRFDYIDNLFAYRYFLAVDNKELQEKELFRFAEYYRGCIGIYEKWRKFRTEKGCSIPCDDCRNKTAMRRLSDCKDFGKYAGN